MELDFDKEIDALLRKAARAPAATASGGHLDPDAIAAFASHSLPAAAKDVYSIHLAECDHCRKQLALAASFDEDTGIETAHPSAVAVPVTVPWYKKYFGVPALAYTMGALALLLSGFIGYSVLQHSNSSASPEVSQIYDNEPQRGGPSFSEEQQVPQAAANANSTGSAATSANTAVNAPRTLSNATTTNTSTMSKAVDPAEPDRSAENEIATGSGAAPPAPPAAPLATPAQLPVTGRTMAETGRPRAEPKVAKEERAATVTLDGVVAQTQNDQKKKAQAPALSARRATEARKDDAEKQLNSQATVNSPAVRSVGGKNFEQRNGVWYDSAYRGQGTKKVRRGSEDYIRLDAGLRSIADSLGGTVIIVWNGKAFRVQ